MNLSMGIVANSVPVMPLMDEKSKSRSVIRPSREKLTTSAYFHSAIALVLYSSLTCVCCDVAVRLALVLLEAVGVTSKKATSWSLFLDTSDNIMGLSIP